MTWSSVGPCLPLLVCEMPFFCQSEGDPRNRVKNTQSLGSIRVFHRIGAGHIHPGGPTWHDGQ